MLQAAGAIRERGKSADFAVQEAPNRFRTLEVGTPGSAEQQHVAGAEG
jgi:hypothetical protein